MWTRAWIQRRRQYELYDQLLIELRHEDPKSFINFMRMPPNMYDEILERIRHRITKLSYREPRHPHVPLGCESPFVRSFFGQTGLSLR